MIGFIYLFVVLYRLQEVSDVAMMQASALQARQQSKEKEVESLRRQIMDYQVTVFFSIFINIIEPQMGR